MEPSRGISPKQQQQQQAVAKKAGGSSRIWMLLDASGESVILDVDKYAVMHRVGIHARDLRILDPLLSYPSTILGRERAIVLNLEHIKAIITAEEVLLRNPADENVIPIVEELCRRLPLKRVDSNGYSENADNRAMQDWQSEQQTLDSDGGEVPPFEFRALEVALEAICSFLDARTSELETSAYPALDELTSKISSRNLDRVRKLKAGMTRLTARVQKVRDELEQLLDDDDDMAELFLTRKLLEKAQPGSPSTVSAVTNWVPVSPTVGSRISHLSKTKSLTSYIHGTDNDIEELEMLLEAYFMQIDGTLNKLNTLREYIDDTEDYINIQLDNHRNQLIQLELLLNSATLSLAIYAMVAGIFGMNIPFTWNDGHGFIFKWVVIVTGIVSLSVFLGLIVYARYRGLVGT